MRACKIDEGRFKLHEVESAYHKNGCDVVWPEDMGLCTRLNCMSDLCLRDLWLLIKCFKEQELIMFNYWFSVLPHFIPVSQKKP